MLEKIREAKSISQRLHDDGHVVAFAGGFVRDLTMGRVPNDIDICTSAHPLRVKELFPHHVADGEDQGVIKVIADDKTVFDIATLRRDGDYLDGRRPDTVEFTSSLFEDSRRRDFTVNAMFINPFWSFDDVIDFHYGRHHIRWKEVRAVGNASLRFEEDKLRMLRAVRFAAQLDFRIHNTTEYAIKESAKDIVGISAERIREELFKGLKSQTPQRFLELLRVTDLLQHILPEVSDLRGCQQDPVHHPEGDVFEHTRLVLKYLRRHTDEPELLMAGLLHDIGKKCCSQPWTDSEGLLRIRNLGHAEEGAKMASAVCDRLKMSNDQKHKIATLVERHMWVHKLPEMKRGKVVAFLRSEFADDQMLLQHADALGAKNELKSNWDWFEEQKKTLKTAVETPALIGGDHLIALGIKPGPLFRVILNEVRELQDSGEITTIEEAIKFVENKEWK